MSVKRFVLVASFFAAAFLLINNQSAHAAASNVYIAQSAAGSGNGSSCANAYAYSFFNSSGNWGSGASQIGPGTTVHVCGTISVGANQEALVFNGSGTSGSPITLYFESGAVLTSPEWPADGSGGAIDLGSHSYVTVNGNGGTNGMTEGVIQATSNGDSNAHCISGSCTSHGDSNGIEADAGAENVTIEGLTISDMYVAVSGVSGGGGGSCMYNNGNVSNWTITDNIMHDMGWCISLQYNGGTSSNLTISDNNIYNIDHGIALGSGSAGETLTNVNVYGNYIHDYSNWDTGAADVWHHDGIHIWGYNDDGSDPISNVNIYDNTFGGSVGTNPTAQIFIERNGGNTKNVSIYNNLVMDTGAGTDNDGLITTGQDGGYKIYNNTIACTNPNNQDIAVGTSNSPNITFINNLVSGCQLGLMYLGGGSVASGQIHNNIYTGGPGNCSQGGDDCFDYGSSGWYGSFSTWESQTGETNSTYVSTANISSLGVPQSGSPAIGAGANLTSLGIGTLDSDIAGVARPSSGAWDVGAYEVSAGSGGGGGGTTVSAPGITSALSVSATAGSSFSYQIGASNSPTSYGASGLPSGLSVNSASGLISGTPSSAGTYSVTISASNSGGTSSATLTLTVASAAVTKYTLAVAKAGTGSGTVTGGSINCGSTCSESANAGTSVTLAASAASGSTFSGWSGACTGTGTCAVTLNAATNVTANFTLQTAAPSVPVVTSALSANGTVGSSFGYQITAINSPTTYAAVGLPSGLSVNSANGVISGTPTSAGTYNVTLNANNAAGVGTATLKITIAAQVTSVNYTLTATTAGTGSGSMTVAGQSCGSSCTATVTGTSQGPVSVTVTETPASGSTFSGWSGACTSTSSSCTFTITGNSTITANFTGSTSTPPPASSGSCSTIGSGWTNVPITSETSGIFTVSFDATPAANDIDAVTGLSTSAASQFTDMAAIVRFNTSGDIDAIDGPNYLAASTLPYQGGITYHVTMTVNLGTKTYSATVSSAGHATTTVALNYPFRDTQAAASSIAYLDAHDDAGTQTVCNVIVGTTSGGSTTPPSGSSPAITSPLTANATVGSSFSYQIGASNSPSSFTATGLPNGLSISNSAGRISGTPTSAGTYAVTLGAVNGYGTGMATLQITIAAAQASTPTPTPVNFTLTASSAGTGSGSMTVAGQNCGSSCTATVSGTSNGPVAAIVTEVPDPGSMFAGWSGACSGTQSTCTLALNSDASVTATFNSTVSNPTSTTSAAPSLTGLGPISGPVGTSVTVTGANFGNANTVLMNGLVAATDVSSDGSSLTFTIPSSLTPNCTNGGACPAYAVLVTSNSYTVSVLTNGQTSNSLTFTVNTAGSSTGSGSGSGSGTGTGTETSSTIVLPTTIQGLQALIASLEAQLATLEAQVNNSSHTFSRDLHYGSYGSDVQALQEFLNQNGYPVASSGPGSSGNESDYFGSGTQSALAAYQQAHGISPASGYFGSITRGYISGQN
ncbi:MAG TPA: putative Ig domain-containing protein [Candidatus Paceibacterota bacterium]|nr:putative Ig domain-containing protein [Candidatus Paceibacterota bacterium]